MKPNEDKNHVLAIEYRSPDELKPNPRNARVHSDKQIQQIARSIQEFGFNVPALVDATGVIIVGHGRIEAAKRVGLQCIPVVTVDHLTPAQVAAFRIADNKLAENSRWDRKLLAEELKYLLAEQIDFHIESTGFEMGEIDLLVEGVEPADADDPADEAPAPHTGPAVTRLGDIWLLGPHRILCGSAVQEQSFARLLQGRKANMVVTDPLSDLRIDRHPLRQAIHYAELSLASSEEFISFLASACALLAANSSDGSLHYLFIDWRHLRELLAATKSIYDEWEGLVVWDKGTGGNGNLYRSQHELILVLRHGSTTLRNDNRPGQSGNTRTNVWSYPALNTRNREEGRLLKLNPTPKPTQLIADAMLDASARGDVVLDSFCGSGTTMIAAERTSRVCYGIELNPDLVDLAVRRWQALTKLSATHAVSRRSFNDIQEEVPQSEN